MGNHGHPIIKRLSPYLSDIHVRFSCCGYVNFVVVDISVVTPSPGLVVPQLGAPPVTLVQPVLPTPQAVVAAIPTPPGNVHSSSSPPLLSITRVSLH